MDEAPSSPATRKRIWVYQTNVSVSEGRLRLIDDNFQTEDRGRVLKTIAEPDQPRFRAKLCLKARLGVIQERPLSAGNPMGAGYFVLYTDPDEREALVKEMLERIMDYLIILSADIESALSAVESRLKPLGR